ncbi:hypothetical protein WICPIJ_009083 [Wickerhamomyces pijperi]|uniref:Superoxide dismutase 1 copper chaperone n=1 Tax=Wickerhamomyces pijperi TaxID=599730 RepID=A0A9P8TEE5_WICPI|nr:hypothetical protein WICPIJ_009083 [Wickerhamomyces pijperi]
MSFETVYNVKLHCQSCVNSVKDALSGIPGVSKFDIDFENQRVSVEGSEAPSNIIKAIQNTGKDAIIRGTGKPNSAAVAILESFNPEDNLAPVKGLARIVATNDESLLVDITLDGLDQGTYYPSFRASGNISQGAESTGGSLFDFKPVTVASPLNDGTGLFSGQSFQSAPLKITDLIGRGFIVTKDNTLTKSSLAGVVARSAGVWENDKQVCSCSGKTIWQERTDAHNHGLQV